MHASAPPAHCLFPTGKFTRAGGESGVQRSPGALDKRSKRRKDRINIGSIRMCLKLTACVDLPPPPPPKKKKKETKKKTDIMFTTKLVTPKKWSSRNVYPNWFSQTGVSYGKSRPQNEWHPVSSATTQNE